ncbi:MAG TPA: metallophosphoesterase family protein [Thermoanaerobaculia bacterium]|nr:metallophosphoesterase family protein [Thermoanaerobaculia bacterium]
MAIRTPRDPDEPARTEPAALTAHRGLATWGETLVPLGRFREAVAAAGQTLSPAARAAAAAEYLSTGEADDDSPVEGPYSRIVVCGGVYNNHLALARLLEEAAKRGAEAVYCLGDLGGFGPRPEKVRPLLDEGHVRILQGNYEESLAAGREDCNCGYTDPRDNHFAELSYRYTAERCSPEFRAWMGGLPRHRRVRVGERELLLVHGSPRRTNEFLWRSTSPVPFLEVLLAQSRCDGLLCTHTGLHWHRRLPSGRDVVNVGVIGRPANDGQPHVWYAEITDHGGELGVELRPLSYDHVSLAGEMRRERIPEEFVATILTGWWTTCLEILPARERAASRF